MTSTEKKTKPGLRDLPLNARYRSNRGDVVKDFYLPAFRVASTYSRAVGYFTSTSLALYSRGIEKFARNGGQMRLIASPNLTQDDVLDIERGYSLRDILTRATERVLNLEDAASVLDGLGLLGRLIADEKLDIKLAFVRHEGRIGIYHEKLGIFRDPSGDLVAFTGSSNETAGGLVANFESIEVYRGWLDGDGERAASLEHDFNTLWANNTPMLSVEDFPEVSRDRLIDLGKERKYILPATADALAFPASDEDSPERFAIPEALRIRDYQRKAVDAWFAEQGRGILKMATGTGKTKTSLIAACKLAEAISQQREEPLVVLIVAPLQHLVDQWMKELREFGIRGIPVYEASRAWLPVVEEQLTQMRLGLRPLVAMVATNKSFSGDKFQAIMDRIGQPFLIIADEVHNLGSASLRSMLPAKATYRLGLSATPERWNDDLGTSALVTYFGNVLFELGLDQAIQIGALCRYNYHPRLITLDEAETELYAELSAKIAVRMAAGEELGAADPESMLGLLLRKRAGVLGHAAGKLAALAGDLKAHRDAWFQLVYCAEGARPANTGEPDGPNQLREVTDLIGNQMRLTAHVYVSDTPRTERKELLRRFGRGDDLQVLIAMRCLDEGVDIPDARTGYLLASSSNPRQFIQRRGRLLRKADGKERAEIFDYLAVPRDGIPINFELERRLLVRELSRANEFGKLSQNYEETLRVLRPLKERYQLMDM
ncbi:DEAD/DEAH box helicase family protein [uncultured Williamsia sp.]|uniref:DEAD/DEAH box helicase family protein n=1 Tax=uncultured Williamsia sp. TaxID=259311 RepID=UPI00262BBE77|nr:DEAD/DEAH box helicase family protein [uncultured Williamsia sp.]